MNWLRFRGGSYSGRERPAQLANRIARLPHAARRTIQNFMRADHSAIRRKTEQFSFRDSLRLHDKRMWNKNACEMGALDLFVVAWLLDWLGWCGKRRSSRHGSPQGDPCGFNRRFDRAGSKQRPI